MTMSEMIKDAMAKDRKRTFNWMAEEIRRKHGISTTPQNLNKYANDTIKKPRTEVIEAIFDVLEIKKRPAKTTPNDHLSAEERAALYEKQVRLYEQLEIERKLREESDKLREQSERENEILKKKLKDLGAASPNGKTGEA